MSIDDENEKSSYKEIDGVKISNLFWNDVDNFVKKTSRFETPENISKFEWNSATAEPNCIIKNWFYEDASAASGEELRLVDSSFS